MGTRCAKWSWVLGACAGCGAPGVHPAPAVNLGSAPPAAAAERRTEPRSLAPASAETGVIRCGSSRCDAQTQVCCTFGGDDVGCAPRVPLAPAEETTDPGRYAPQVTACQQAVPTEYSFSDLAYCDDTTDCPQGTVCCAGAMWGDSSLSECRPARADGANACQFFEVCHADTPCGTAGTTCRGGACGLAAVSLACGAARCTAELPVCCADESGGVGCVAHAESACSLSEGRFAAECQGPADCPAGMSCCAGLGRNYCSGECINTAIACVTAADCPPDYAGFALRACDPDSDPRPPRRYCRYSDP